MELKKFTIVAAILCTYSLAVPAQVVRAEDAIRYRKAAMIMMKWHFDRLSQLTKGTVPFHRGDAERNATWLAMLSKNAAEGFISGSHEGDTKAQSTIWSDAQKFHTLVDRFQAEALKLQDIAQKGEIGLIKSQLDIMARTCKSCHDEFKKS